GFHELRLGSPAFSGPTITTGFAVGKDCFSDELPLLQFVICQERVSHVSIPEILRFRYIRIHLTPRTPYKLDNVIVRAIVDDDFSKVRMEFYEMRSLLVVLADMVEN